MLTMLENSLLPTLQCLRHHARLLVWKRPILFLDMFSITINLQRCHLRVNYGCLLHVSAPAIYIIPLTLQALPAV
jgi:hypothetical protein